ncbi:dihydrolipoamide acyltransferase component [Nonlabens ulvanivorans]|uniref:Dihydrolipoamide acyltransferase component n=4 Tax=Nonlabens ulvanivorans TaxID=906888 RepID=A0A090QDM3_NONUL|nr:dihydrolipoamide acyltransferase component [Nonlabens ulvanivorans]
MTKDGVDSIEIRSMMMLSLSFDHRVVDGFLGGSFLKQVALNLEAAPEKNY